MVEVAATKALWFSGCEMSYCFRIRVKTPKNTTLETELSELALAGEPGAETQIVMRTKQSGETLKSAAEWVILGSGFQTEETASASAMRWRSRLMRATALVGLGLDFGDRAATGMFTTEELRWAEAESGQRVLNDKHGIIIYECAPRPKFVSMSVSPMVGRGLERFLEAIANQPEFDLSQEQQLAYELYSASFFVTYADSRFLLLMMALESLIEPQPKSDVARDLITGFIDEAQHADLNEKEIKSLTGSLHRLLDESITQAGRRLAQNLGDELYMDFGAEKFFVKCYELRSKLAHGSSPRPDRGQVDILAAHLERFVGDLIAADPT